MLPIDHIEAPVIRDLVLSGGTILVIGAYKGDTVAFVREHHPESTIFAYEPQIWAWQECCRRFAGDPKVKLFNYGLGRRYNSAQPLYEFGTDAASVIQLEGWRTRDFVVIHDAAKILVGGDPELKWPALCIMNIEGAEYDLIQYMLEMKLHPKSWLVQFHFKDRMAREYNDVYYSLFEIAGYTREIIGKGWEFWQ